LAITSDTRVEACVLFRDLPQRHRREIVALGGTTQRADGGAAAWALLEIVVRVACQAGSMEVTVPRVSSQEICWDRLESIGFHNERTYTRYVAIPNSNTQ
jgi:hypothetical protein